MLMIRVSKVSIEGGKAVNNEDILCADCGALSLALIIRLKSNSVFLVISTHTDTNPLLSFTQ